MSLKCGIVGLPNVGKSTLFNALTKAGIAAENYPFCTIEPNVGVVEVPDPRLKQLADIIHPERVVPAIVEFVDIAGLVAGASKGEGLGNQFLAHIRETDAIVNVVRCFEDENVIHVAGKVDPIADIEVIQTELCLADLGTVEKSLHRYVKAARSGNDNGRTQGGSNADVLIADAFAKGDMLQVLLLSLLFGFSLAAMKETGNEVVSLINKLAQVLFGIVETLMKLAPIGAFGAMAFTIGKYGVASLIPLVKMMGSFYLTCLVFIFVVLGLIARLAGFSILKFIIYIKEELLIVLGTSSSESVLPRIMHKLEKLGCSKSVVGLVIPTGYSFNLDGTSIYLSMAALFVAQATNTQLTIMQELTLLAVLLLTSKGAAGVTGSGFITLAATLAAVPSIPVAGLALILGIDRFMSEARALTNLIGNGVATVVAAHWEGELDNETLKHELDNA